MAANADPKLSTITSPAGAVRDGLPVVVVYKTTSDVSVEWGKGGAQRTFGALGGDYSVHPYNFHAVDSDGNVPLVKAFGSLLHCEGGILTIRQSRYRINVIQQQQQPDDGFLRKSRAEEAADAAAILVRRMELASKRGRPQRTLSYVTKSHAFQSNIVQGKVSFNVPFFFDLIETKFETDAFKTPGPAAAEDENSKHHPYFIRELAKLVAAANAAGVQVRQRVHLSRAGKWLSLDDGISSGVEPDFCTTDAYPNHAETVLVPSNKDPVSPPASKYDVELMLEAKKGFRDTDQMEVIDYSERILCTQRGHSVAYGALIQKK